MESVFDYQITLRQLSPKYIQHYLHAFVPLVQQILHVSSADAEHQYLMDRLPLIAQKKTHFFVVFEKETDCCIGAIEIRGVEHKGQLYCWLHPTYWGKSYFWQMLMLAARIYFQITNALYFTARVDIDNTRSYKALKKCGFADYGIVCGPYGKQYELIFRKQ